MLVWGGITAHHRTQLEVINGNLTGIQSRDEVLHPHVLPFLQVHGRHIILQQDNTRHHVTRVVTDFITQQDIPTLSWPAVSPDLSSIEHVWDEMERRCLTMHRLQNQPATLARLRQALVQIWNDISQAFFNHLVSSMRCRCQVCVNTNGGHTRY